MKWPRGFWLCLGWLVGATADYALGFHLSAYFLLGFCYALTGLWAWSGLIGDWYGKFRDSDGFITVLAGVTALMGPLGFMLVALLSEGYKHGYKMWWPKDKPATLASGGSFTIQVSATTLTPAQMNAKITQIHKLVNGPEPHLLAPPAIEQRDEPVYGWRAFSLSGNTLVGATGLAMAGAAGRH